MLGMLGRPSMQSMMLGMLVGASTQGVLLGVLAGASTPSTMVSLVYRNGVSPSRTTFVFNSKFYFSNKLEVTNRLRSIYLCVSCLQNNPNPVYRT